MWLSIEPDFNTKSINCEQQLKITTLQDLEKIELDCAYNDKQKIGIVLFSIQMQLRRKVIRYYHSNSKMISY
jgi:hypothetical protein